MEMSFDFLCLGFPLLFVWAFFLQTLMQAIGEVAPRNRRISPEAMWLNLIPGFHFYWAFVTVMRLSDSLELEFVDRGINRPGERPSETGRMVGLLWAGASVFAVALLVVALVGALHDLAVAVLTGRGVVLAILLAGVCFIIYWVHLRGTIAQLKAWGPGDPDRDDEPPSTAITKREMDR